MFVVFDVETTGLFPSWHHRVVEIAAVKVDEGGKVQEEFISLLNPQRDIGPTSIHGLISADILDAPTFSDLAGDIAEFFDGACTYVGHNVMFDADFLRAEFGRCQVEVPTLPLLCTMRSAGGGRLEACCEEFGISPPTDAHTALDDARAATMLLAELIRHERAAITAAPTRWPMLPKSGKRPVTRSEVRQRPQTNHYLQRLAELVRDDFGPPDDIASMAYLTLLERVLEDRRIDADEGDALIETAARWGLSLTQVEHLHSEFMRRLGAVALIDGVVTDSERRDIHQVAILLGRSTTEVDLLLDEASRRVAAVKPAAEAVETSLTECSVCFTGELLATIGGRAISRAEAQLIATQAGLKVQTASRRNWIS